MKKKKGVFLVDRESRSYSFVDEYSDEFWQDKFNKFNAELFEGKIPNLPVKVEAIANRGHVAALFNMHFDRENDIILNPYNTITEMPMFLGDMEAYLIHEMCHAYYFYNHCLGHCPQFERLVMSKVKAAGVKTSFSRC